MKQIVPKLYIPTGDIKNGQVISANKIKELKPYLPCEEALRVHMDMQRIQLMKNHKYKPKPLYFSIEKAIFKQVIDKIKFKGIDGRNDFIPLFLQYPGLPICILQPKLIENE